MAELGYEDNQPPDRYEVAVGTQVAVRLNPAEVGGAQFSRIGVWAKRSDEGNNKEATIRLVVWDANGIFPGKVRWRSEATKVSRNGGKLNFTPGDLLTTLTSTFYMGIVVSKSSTSAVKIGVGQLNSGLSQTYEQAVSGDMPADFPIPFNGGGKSPRGRLAIYATYQKTTKPDRPTNPNPANDANLLTGPTQFTASSSATATHALIEVRRKSDNVLLWNAGGAPQLLSQPGQIVLAPSTPLEATPGSKYTWRVAAVDRFNQRSEWSNEWTYEIASTGESGTGTFAPQSPLFGSVLTTTPKNATFSARWDHPTGAKLDKFRVYFYRKDGTSYSLLKDLPNNDWRDPWPNVDPGGVVSVSGQNLSNNINDLLTDGTATYAFGFYGVEAGNNGKRTPTPDQYPGGLFEFRVAGKPNVPSDLRPVDWKSSTLPNLNWLAAANANETPGVTLKWQVEVVPVSASGGTYTATTQVYNSTESRGYLDLRTVTNRTFGFGSYKWRVRGENDGGWGDWSGWATFTYADGPELTITSPTPGQSLTTSSPAIAWTITRKGPGASYRVTILDALDGKTAYDSGVVASAATTHTVPAGFLRGGRTYTADVRVWNAPGEEGRAEPVRFVIAYVPGPGVSAVWCEPVGTELDPSPTAVAVNWTPMDIPSVEFGAYLIYRKAYGETTPVEVLVAKVTVKELGQWIDWHAPAGQVLDYTVRVTTTQNGDDQMSAGQTATTEFDMPFVVITGASTGQAARAILRWKPATRSGEWTQEQAVYTTWGSGNLPTVFYSAGTQTVVDASFRLLTDFSGERNAYWRALRRLYESQEVVSYRDERQAFFGRIASLSYDMEDNSDSVSIRVEEVAFTEGVTE